jgi:hypothetical protein
MSAALITGGVDYAEGSVIEYVSFEGARRRVKVDIVSAPAGDLPRGSDVWGYDSQITEVISR